MKRIYLVIIMIMAIGFTGCSKTADSNFTIPAFSDALLSIEIPEPAPIEEPEPVDNTDSLNEGSIGGQDTIDSETSQDETNETTQETQTESGLETEKLELTDEITQKLLNDLDLNELSKTDIVFFTDPKTNDGNGYDYNGKHYETLGEMRIARISNEDGKSNKEIKEEADAMKEGFVYYENGVRQN